MDNNRWDELSLTDKAEVMKQAVAKGITNLQDIRDNYNDTVNNYIDNIYANGTEESYGDPSDHYNNVDEEMISHMSPDARGHYDDSVKLPNHPSSPTRGTFNGQYFDFTDKGFEDPNYTLFGLQDNGDGNTIMRYNGDVVMPELTVTPNGNYYDDTYNNIKIQQGHKHELGGPVKHDARYNHATQIYQSYINQGVNPQTALELTNQKIAEKGWTGWVSGDNKRYNNVNSFTDHTIDQFNRLYPDSLKSNNFNQFFQGIEGGRTKYNPTPNTYRQHLLQTRPGVKKRINEYRRVHGQSPLTMATPMPWDLNIFNTQPSISIEQPITVEQPVMAADGGYLHSFKGGGKLSVQNQRAGYAVNYFMNKGLSKVAAAGLVGNLMRESRMDPNALNPDKYGSAHGLAQFRGARWKNLQKMYGNNPTFEQQLDYIWHELNTTHKKGLQMLKSSRTVDEAAKNAFGYYEFSKGPEDAIAQMAKYNKKMGYNQANGYKAMNDGINNAWVAYGKANPNIKLSGLNLGTPSMGFNGVMPQHDFAGVVDSINLDSPLYSTNSSSILPPDPTNYGKPVDYSTIKHPEKEVPATLDWSKGEEDDNSNMGIFSLMNTISSIGKPKSPLATYTPQKQNNAPFTVGISQSKSDFLDIPLMAAYGGKLYDKGVKKDNDDKEDDVVYREPVKPVGKTKVVSVADPSKGEIAVHPDDIPVTTAPLGGNTDDVDWDYINQFTNDTPTEEDINDAMDKKISDYLTASNDATAVGSSSNAHLQDRSNYGAMAHAEWERQHPALTDWSYLPTIATGAAVAAPIIIGAGDAIAGTTVGNGIYNGLATIANTAKSSTLLPWADAATTAYFGVDALNNDVRNGNVTPETVLELAPMVRAAKGLVQETAKGVKAATNYLDRNMGYWGDNLVSRTYGTVARRYDLPTTSQIPETYRALNIIPNMTETTSSSSQLSVQDAAEQGRQAFLNYVQSPWYRERLLNQGISKENVDKVLNEIYMKAKYAPFNFSKTIKQLDHSYGKTETKPKFELMTPNLKVTNYDTGMNPIMIASDNPDAKETAFHELLHYTTANVGKTISSKFLEDTKSLFTPNTYDFSNPVTGQKEYTITGGKK